MRLKVTSTSADIINVNYGAFPSAGFLRIARQREELLWKIRRGTVLIP